MNEFELTENSCMKCTFLFQIHLVSMSVSYNSVNEDIDCQGGGENKGEKRKLQVSIEFDW